MGSMSAENDALASRVAEAINYGFKEFGIDGHATSKGFMWSIAVYFGEDPRVGPVSCIKLPETTDETGLVTVHI